MVVGRAEEKILDHQTVHRHDHRRVQGSPCVVHRLAGVGEHREVGAYPVPNPDEAPGGQATDVPSERRLFLCSAMVVPAASASGHVFWRDFPMPVQTQRVGTTPVWRRCHHREGACRETVGPSSAASQRRGARVPSASKTWLHRSRSPVRARFGGGAAHGTRARLSPHRQAPERMSNQRPKDLGQRASVLLRVH
jgi:hypothetical protein